MSSKWMWLLPEVRLPGDLHMSGSILDNTILCYLLWIRCNQHMDFDEGMPDVRRRRLEMLQLVSTFPTSAKFWRLYVEAELAANNDDAVKQLFSTCLLHCLHVDLWRAYLRYMRNFNDNRGPKGREEMKKAFQYMLGHIGFDINAGPVWLEYISFFESCSSPYYRFIEVIVTKFFTASTVTELQSGN